MTFITLNQLNSKQPSGAIVKRFMALLSRLAAQLSRSRRRGNISKLTPRELRDIGLTPHDIGTTCDYSKFRDEGHRFY